MAVNLNAVRGRRKAILYVGEDHTISRSDGPLDAGFSRARQRTYDDMVRMAVRNNVRIYPIDPRGYLVRFADMTAEGFSDVLPTGPAASGFGEGMDARILASDTGGIAIVNTGNYRGNFSRIVRDNNGYYVIAFYSNANDGEFHRLKIRVKNRPVISVRAGGGYRATAPDLKGPAVKLPKSLSASASEALRTASPGGDGPPVEVFTAVFQGDRFDGSLLIGCHVPGAMLNLASKERIELSYVAVDRWGVTRAVDRRAYTLTLSNELRAQVAQGGLRLFGRLKLPRGRYQIRVAAHQPNGRLGSTFADVEVPDYTELPMSVSDLVLSSSHGATLTTLEEDAVLRRALPSQPTARRRFRAEETVSVFGEIYNSQWALTPNVGVTTVIQSVDKRVVHRDEQTLTTANRGRVYYRGRMPLARFTPGEYLIVLESYTRDGIPASASQQLQFEVVE